jgi:hypothetical protein
MVLLEATGLTLIMGLFPPLRPMLYGTAALVLLLVAYVAFLLQARAHEVEQARLRRSMEARRGAPPARPEPAMGRYGPPLSRRAPVRAAAGSRYPSGNGAPARSLNSEGYEAFRSLGVFEDSESSFLREGGVQIIDDDVHVIVYRSDEIELSEVRAAAR